MSELVGNGLFDLQVNGYAGVDFNDPALTAAGLDHALEAMLAAGVTQCLPTLITGLPSELHERFVALDRAVRESRLGRRMVPGYHLEGPFLNSEEGFRGCHPGQAMQDADPALVANLQAAIELPILLVTLAPERAGAIDLTSKLTEEGRVVSIGHSSAGYAEVAAATAAGLSMSTHLGNGLPQLMPKLNNSLMAQLASRELVACLIADGHHLTPEALKAVINLKGADNCILVTDAVSAAGAKPGPYSLAGMHVLRTQEGAVVQPGHEGLFGSALCLDDAIRNVCAWNIVAPPVAIAMASTRPRQALSGAFKKFNIPAPTCKVSWNDNLEPTVLELPAEI